MPTRRMRRICLALTVLMLLGTLGMIAVYPMALSSAALWALFAAVATAALREKRGELRLCRRIQADIPRVSQQCQQAQAERQKNLKNKEEHDHEYQCRNR